MTDAPKPKRHRRTREEMRAATRQRELAELQAAFDALRPLAEARLATATGGQKAAARRIVRRIGAEQRYRWS